VKFNENGVRQWATYFGGNDVDNGHSCSSDGNGNFYISGVTRSTTAVGSGGHQDTIGGGSDAFLLKVNGNGAHQWSTYYGGSSNDLGFSCMGDLSGNIYLSGETRSTTEIAFAGHQNTKGGINDAFLVKFDSSGVRQWATYYGGDIYDYGFSIATDESSNVYMAGQTMSPTSIAQGGHQNYFGGSTDAFMVKFSSSGVLQWATYYGGSNGEYGYWCDTDNSGNIYLAGWTWSSTGISSGGYQNAFGGVGDAFLVKFTTGEPLLTGTYTVSETCANQCNGVQMAAPSGGVPPYSFQWNTEPEQSGPYATDLCEGELALTVTDALDSTFTLLLTVASVGGTDAIDLTQLGDTLYASGLTDYQWYLNDTLIPGANLNTYVIIESGNYNVSGNIGDCSVVSELIETTCICTGISDLGDEILMQALHVFPNPSNSIFSMVIKDALGAIQIIVTDNMGREVLMEHFSATGNSARTIDMSARASGIYFLRVQTENSAGVVKLVKE
jgi:hypothetical protein